MSAAAKKNEDALFTLFKSRALVNRLLSSKIAVISPARDEAPSCGLLATVLADLLGRLWPCIDFHGGLASNQRAVAAAAAASGGSPTDDLCERLETDYDVLISIDCDAPTGTSFRHHLRISADNWVATFGPSGKCGASMNPVGPAFAAALCSAQLFLRIFSSELKEGNPDFIVNQTFDLRDLFHAPALLCAPLDIGHAHFFGAGAVTHAFVWLLENWPYPVTGRAALVDSDEYGSSNGQRYSSMSAANQGQLKVAAIEARLLMAHPHLASKGHPIALNAYCLHRGYFAPLERIVVGVDSPEGRRQSALKLPEHTINMWTGGDRAGGSRYVPDGLRACLACDYLEDVSNPLDLTAQLVIETGLRPDLVRTLLDSPRGLTQDEAQTIANHRGVQAQTLVGSPILSLRPILCATGTLQPGGSEAETIDVPFAFASMLAGIAGFVMMLKDLSGEPASEGWSQSAFHSPTPYMREIRSRKLRCVCCSELFEALPR